MKQTGRLGGISDLNLDLRWNAATLANEIACRAGVLFKHGIGRGSLVVIAHADSARYMGFSTDAVNFNALGVASENINQHVQVVLVGLNYRFGSWGARAR